MCVRARWARPALLGGQDEFGWSAVIAADEKHVAAGAVEQGCKDLGGNVGAVLAEDALIGDAAGDLDSCLAGDLAKNLVKAGVVGGDEERAC